MSVQEVMVVDGKRTPFGRFGGSLKDISAVELGAKVLRAVLSGKPIEPEEIGMVIMGICLPGSGLSPGRQALLAADLPVNLSALTVDRACCSAMTAMGLAYEFIKNGRMEVALAGGMENMSQTPYLLPQIRWGQRLGDFTVKDELVIRNPYVKAPMAQYAGEVALEYGVSREEQDNWALHSHLSWVKAYQEGKFQEEVIPVSVPQPKGENLIFDTDEHPRPDTNIEKLAKLKPVYGSPTVTAGNASGICDGATATLLMSKSAAEKKGLAPLARILSHVAICGEPRQSPALPAEAIRQSLELAGLSLEEMALIEINEAFAPMPLVSSLILGNRDPEKVKEIRAKLNVKGGAIAIGHPIGASGARLVMTLAYELRQRKERYGVAAICGAVGQADAMVIEAL